MTVVLINYGPKIDYIFYDGGAWSKNCDPKTDNIYMMPVVFDQSQSRRKENVWKKKKKKILIRRWQWRHYYPESIRCLNSRGLEMTRGPEKKKKIQSYLYVISLFNDHWQFGPGHVNLTLTRFTISATYRCYATGNEEKMCHERRRYTDTSPCIEKRTWLYAFGK